MAKFLRYMRIAFSATCVIVAVLLCALWVRSYWWVSQDVCRITENRFVGYGIQPGVFGIGTSTDGDIPLWTPTDQFLEDAASYGESYSRIWGFFQFKTEAFIAPFWCLVLLTIALSALPWLRYRFSLRTLLIATTLVALVLGLVVWAVR